MERKRIAEATKGIGKPKVGGAFELLDYNGQKFTSEDMKGKYALVGVLPLQAKDRRNVQEHGQASELMWGLTFLHTAGVFWLHPLSRHMPGRAGQDGPDNRSG